MMGWLVERERTPSQIAFPIPRFYEAMVGWFRMQGGTRGLTAPETMTIRGLDIVTGG